MVNDVFVCFEDTLSPKIFSKKHALFPEMKIKWFSKLLKDKNL